MKRLNYSLAVFAAGIAFAMPPQWGVQAAAPTRVQATVPFRMSRSGIMLLEVGLTDRRRSTFMLDTGANMSLITDTAVRKLRLMPRPALKADGSPLRFPDGAPGQMVTAPRLSLGSVDYNNTDLAVVRSRIVEPIGEGIDGVIGAYTLQGSAVLFDFPKQEVTFSQPGELGLPERAEVGLLDAMEVPLSDPRGNLAFTARIWFTDQTSEECLIDTGALRTQISRRTAMRLKLKERTEGRVTQSAFATYRVDYDRVPEMRIGGMVLRDIEVEYPQTEGAAGSKPVLGLDVLSKFKVLIDFPASKMYLLRVRPGMG